MHIRSPYEKEYLSGCKRSDRRMRLRSQTVIRRCGSAIQSLPSCRGSMTSAFARTTGEESTQFWIRLGLPVRVRFCRVLPSEKRELRGLG